MGKVKGGDDKFRNEVVGNRKRKKRIKELEILRRRVLETKRKLREKTALPKTQSSTSFAKILNKFADRRQANDNKTQGFDYRGRKTGIKKMCNRLLPLRKPQAGIFANGSKGAEIKRVNLALNESDRARLEGDLQKILCNGKCTSKESKSDCLMKIMERRLSTESIESEDERNVENLKEIIGVKKMENFTAEIKKSSKRKIPDSINSDERVRKKSNSQIEIAKNATVPDAKVKSDGNRNIAGKKSTWKRSLFQDEEEEFEHSICEPIAMELRFSPRNFKANIISDREKSKIFSDSAGPRHATERFDSDYGQLGKMATTRYEELCAIVCGKNFDNCLREIPHVDPLKSVKKYLTNFYVDSCRRKSLKNPFPKNESTTGDSINGEELYSIKNSRPVDTVIRNTKHCHGDIDLEKLRLDCTDSHQPFENSENIVHHPEAKTKIHTSVKREILKDKSVSDLSSHNKFRNDIPVKNLWVKRACLDYLTSEKSSNFETIDSLGVNNCESPKASLEREVASIDLKFGGKIRQTNVTVQKLAKIPENRQKIMLRYLRDQLLVKNQETIVTPELETMNQAFTDNNDFQIPGCFEHQLKRDDDVKEMKKEEQKREGELNIEELKLKMNKKIGASSTGEKYSLADRYLNVEMKNFNQEKTEDEMKMEKRMKRYQEAKKSFGNVHKKCEKHVPAILRKSRDRRLGKCSANDFAKLMIMNRKAQSSLGEISPMQGNARKPSRTNSQFFVDIKSRTGNDRDQIEQVNDEPNEKCEPKIISSNNYQDQHFKNSVNHREASMTNVFGESPSIDRLESLAAQSSRSLLFLNNEKIKSKDRSLFISECKKFDSDTDSQMTDRNLAEGFSPLFFEPRIKKDKRRLIFPDNKEPKVIIIHENDRNQDRRTIDNTGANFLQPNYHRVVSTSSGMKQIPFVNVRNGLPVGDADAEILAYENYDGVRRAENRNPVNIQPRAMYHDQETVLKLGNDSTVYIEPTTLNVVQNSRGEFHPVQSINRNQTQPWVPPFPFGEGNSNFNENTQTTSQLYDNRRIQGLILPRNEREPYFQNVIVDPDAQRFAGKIIQRQDYGTILTRDQNFCYQYVAADPRTYPQDGYKRSQIDESGSNQRRHQPVIQPVYNVTGAYRPREVSHNYFSTGGP